MTFSRIRLKGPVWDIFQIRCWKLNKKECWSFPPRLFRVSWCKCQERHKEEKQTPTIWGGSGGHIPWSEPDPGWTAVCGWAFLPNVFPASLSLERPPRRRSGAGSKIERGIWRQLRGECSTRDWIKVLSVVELPWIFSTSLWLFTHSPVTLLFLDRLV